MKTILFYWSKGADVRRKIIKIIKEAQGKNEPIFLNRIASILELTHVTVKVHLDLLVEEGYVSVINPEGKPHFLNLTKKGEGLYRELSSR
jgi:predicted ArsR family transcriptional regulator